MFARERRNGRVDGRRASTGRASRKDAARPPRLAFFAHHPPRGTSRLDIAYTHYERHDLTLQQTYFVPHFRAASTNAWTLPSGVGWSTP